MSLENKVALITGSSRGIGAKTAELLADRGARVVVNYNSSADAAESVATSIRDDGGEAMVVQADVRERDDVETMVDELRSEWGSIDVLVSNANMSFARKPLAEMTWAEFSQKLNDELRAAFVTSKAVLPGMADQEWGRVVYVSSGLGKHPAPGMIAHGTAKAGLDTFTKYVAAEYGPKGITANVVAPGLTETDATAGQPDERKEQVAQHTPLGRVGQPEDVAHAIAALVGDDGQFLTGTYTPVNGGMRME